MKTLQEKYNLVKEGKLSKSQFKRDARMELPNFLTTFNGFEDTVSILKHKGILSETVVIETPKKNSEVNISLDVIETGVDFELEKAGIDSAGNVTKEQYLVAKRKAVQNLTKDINYYVNLIAVEDKTPAESDKMKEYKKGQEKDQANDMKKVALKESSMVKEVLASAIGEIFEKYKNIPDISLIIKKFATAHSQHLMNGANALEEFENFINTEYNSLESQPQTQSLPSETVLKESIKSIIVKILSENKKAQLQEAATVNLSNYTSEDYSDFSNLPQCINGLENIVTEIESFYHRINEKVQGIFDKVGEITNEEGLRVGPFIAPGIHAAFIKDLAPVRKNFLQSTELPKTKMISQADILSAKQAQGLEEDPKQTLFTPVMESDSK
jgi:hypothetical protein